MSEGTIHTDRGWKTDGKYGLYRRTAPNDKGEGAGREVLIKEEHYDDIGETVCVDSDSEAGDGNSSGS